MHVALLATACDVGARSAGAPCEKKEDCDPGFICLGRSCRHDYWGTEDGGGKAKDAGGLEPITDAALHDASTPDIGSNDDDVRDAGTTDTGPFDMGPTDIGSFDTSVVDVGTSDASHGDTGSADADLIDAGAHDGGTADCGFAPDPDTLALFHFGEASGTALLDAVGGTPGDLAEGARITGVCGDGLAFTNGEYALFGTIIPDGQPSGTVEITFRFDQEFDPKGSYIIVGNQSSRANLLYKADSLLFLKNHDYDHKFVQGLAILSRGVWHHVAGMWGPKGMRLFLDGKLIAANADTSDYRKAPPDPVGGNEFMIGRKNFCCMEGAGITTPLWLEGSVDELRFSRVERY